MATFLCGAHVMRREPLCTCATSALLCCQQHGSPWLRQQLDRPEVKVALAGGPLPEPPERALLNRLLAGVRALHDLVDQTDPNDPIGAALTKAGLEHRP